MKKKEIIIMGFALFAMFFGAGNLIFPPSIGVNVGKDWFFSGIGFLLTGVGLPLLGILSFTKIGKLDNFAIQISSRFNTAYCTCLVLVIGPLFAIPRTGSTTLEMGILPFINSEYHFFVSIIGAILFFSLTLALVLKKSTITDIIGKFLTPIILIILILLSFLGITKEIGSPISKNIDNVFTYGFINGYQTMDAIASVLFGSIIVKGLEEKGITNFNEKKKYLSIAGIIAAIGLGLIYFCLIYLGARISGISNFSSTTMASLYLAELTMGHLGKLIFGICVSAACLTTSVGLVALVGDWFEKITPFSYKTITIFTCIFSTIMAINGVDFIIKLSIPVLCILYPVTIVLILLNIFEISNKLVYRTATYITLTIVILQMIVNSLKISYLYNFFNSIPFSKSGFAWLFPCLIGIVISIIISKKRTKVL